MTLEETAKIFSEKWNKDINRTHIASAKRMAQNLFNNENQLNLDHHQKSTDDLLQGGGSGSLGLNQVMRGTDQNRNNEVMGHSYGVTERKLSQDDHLSSGIDLYSQFQLGNHKQVSPFVKLYRLKGYDNTLTLSSRRCTRTRSRLIISLAIVYQHPCQHIRPISKPTLKPIRPIYLIIKQN